MKFKGKGWKHFNQAICRFKYPVPKFSSILSPLMPEYTDLMFIAMEKGKEEIVLKLIQLGAEWRWKEMLSCPYSICGSLPENSSLWMSVKERAGILGMTNIVDAINK